MTDMTVEMLRMQRTGIKVVIEMAELQCLEVEPLLSDPVANRSHILQIGSMFLDIAHIALSFGMDGTVARKLEDMGATLNYILDSEAMIAEYHKARESLAYVLSEYKP